MRRVSSATARRSMRATIARLTRTTVRGITSRVFTRLTSLVPTALLLLNSCTAPPADAALLPEPLLREFAAGSPRPPATLADIAWLQGDWVGTGLGGDVEESWGPPGAGAMLARFRFVKGGKPVFYELVALAEAEGSLELRVKHFSPDLVGREDKDKAQVFPLVRLDGGPDGGTAWFDGITFHRVDSDHMLCWVRIVRNGTTRDERFDYRRAH